MRIEVSDNAIFIVPETPMDVSHLRVLGFPEHFEIVAEQLRREGPADKYNAGFRVAIRRVVPKKKPPEVPPATEVQALSAAAIQETQAALQQQLSNQDLAAQGGLGGT